VWRGGRPLKKTPAPSKLPAKPAKVNGTSNDAIMIIDSDDDEPAKTASQQPVPAAEFEDEEEELDPDQPYPSFVQQLRLALNTEVLHIAVPQVPTVTALRPAESIPAVFATKMVFTVVCADCTVRVITLPLSPPADAAKEQPQSAKSQFGEEVVKVQGHQSIPRGTSMTWTSRTDPTPDARVRRWKWTAREMLQQHKPVLVVNNPVAHFHTKPAKAGMTCLSLLTLLKWEAC
jgi:hypothetical protein